MGTGSYGWRSRRAGRRRPSRAWGLVALGVVPLGLVAALLYPLLNGWTYTPDLARAQARVAVDEARGLEAGRWAPELLSRCEEQLRATLAAERGEAARLFFFRDFREIEASYYAVREQAQLAGSTARRQMDEARTSARAILDTAGMTLESATRIADRMPFPGTQRMLLQLAQMRLSDGEVYFANSEFVRAAAEAEAAIQEAEKACRQALPLLARFIDREEVATWRRWIDETIAWSRNHGEPAIVVYKEKNRLDLYAGGKKVRSYEADMGKNCLNPKRRSGDEATPEGRYRITAKKDRGQSAYYKALLLNYPNDEDRRRFEAAKRRGAIPSRARMGEYIEIHGEGGRGVDWTLGCVALSNADMADLFSRVRVGDVVTIVGGDGHDGAFSDLARSAAAARFTEGSPATP